MERRKFGGAKPSIVARRPGRPDWTVTCCRQWGGHHFLKTRMRESPCSCFYNQVTPFDSEQHQSFVSKSCVTQQKPWKLKNLVCPNGSPLKIEKPPEHNKLSTWNAPVSSLLIVRLTGFCFDFSFFGQKRNTFIGDQRTVHLCVLLHTVVSCDVSLRLYPSLLGPRSRRPEVIQAWSVSYFCATKGCTTDKSKHVNFATLKVKKK